jgi:hypothetical protein
MKSTIASLRSLTLPFGATSGMRIELDGVNGEIRIYDVDGDLLIKIEGEFGFQGFDSSGNVRIRVSSPFGGAYSAIQFWTAQLDETHQGLISVADFAASNRMVLSPGQQGSKGNLEWTLMSTPNDNSVPALLQAVGLTLDDPASPRPIIDLTGAATPAETQYPHTVVYDLYQGLPDTFGFEPLKVHNYARGSKEEWLGISTTDVNIATVGVWRTVVQVTPVSCLAGRLYEVKFDGGDNVFFSGSGFAAGDAVRFRLTKDGNSMGTSKLLQSNFAASARFPMPSLAGYFSPSVDGDYTLRCEVQRVAGAATVTIQALTGPLASQFNLAIKDIGETANPLN